MEERIGRRSRATQPTKKQSKSRKKKTKRRENLEGAEPSPQRQSSFRPVQKERQGSSKSCGRTEGSALGMKYLKEPLLGEHGRFCGQFRKRACVPPKHTVHV